VSEGRPFSQPTTIAYFLFLFLFLASHYLEKKILYYCKTEKREKRRKRRKTKKTQTKVLAATYQPRFAQTPLLRAFSVFENSVSIS